MTRKTTLTVHAGNEARALEIAATFRSQWTLHHHRHAAVAHQHGVIFIDRSPRIKFYVWGWDGHVRVVEEKVEL